MEWCRACDRGLPAPDCIIFLDMPVQDAAQRGEFGAERYEKVEFQIKVREQFRHLQEADASNSGTSWHVIDARGSIADIHAQISAIVERTMEDVAQRPLGRMFPQSSNVTL